MVIVTTWFQLRESKSSSTNSLFPVHLLREWNQVWRVQPVRVNRCLPALGPVVYTGWCPVASGTHSMPCTARVPHSECPSVWGDKPHIIMLLLFWAPLKTQLKSQEVQEAKENLLNPKWSDPTHHSLFEGPRRVFACLPTGPSPVPAPCPCHTVYISGTDSLSIGPLHPSTLLKPTPYSLTCFVKPLLS